METTIHEKKMPRLSIDGTRITGLTLGLREKLQRRNTCSTFAISIYSSVACNYDAWRINA